MITLPYSEKRYDLSYNYHSQYPDQRRPCFINRDIFSKYIGRRQTVTIIIRTCSPGVHRNSRVLFAATAMGRSACLTSRYRRNWSCNGTNIYIFRQAVVTHRRRNLYNWSNAFEICREIQRVRGREHGASGACLGDARRIRNLNKTGNDGSFPSYHHFSVHTNTLSDCFRVQFLETSNNVESLRNVGTQWMWQLKSVCPR